MPQLEIQSLFAEIHPDLPCGEDISYDPVYLALERSLLPSAGGVISDPTYQEPDWKEIYQQSYALLLKSKNLRVALFFTLSQLKLNGFSGFKDGLSVLRCFVERFWNDVYPHLDPEDNYDTLERRNILMALSADSTDQDPCNFKRRIMEVPLCESVQLGRFSFRDIQIARGALTVPGLPEENRPSAAVIEAAFRDAAPQTIAQTRQDIEVCIEHITAIGQSFASQSIHGQSPSFDGVLSLLGSILKSLQSYEITESRPVESTEGSSAPKAEMQSAVRATGEIRSPQDAVEQIEKICDYFARHEPSSPVPLLLQRAKRLVGSKFVDVIRDVCPDAIHQVELISGISAQQAPEQS